MLFVFLDGVGLGENDANVNPLVASDLPVLRALIGDAPHRAAAPRSEPGLVFRPLDAGLGHAGAPQSATGQTALLTGLNASDLMNGHYGPWPGPTLLKVLANDTLFHDGQAQGGSALANAYPPDYFSAIRATAMTAARRGRRLRHNAPVAAAIAAGVALRGVEAYRRGEALASDLEGAYFEKLGAGLARSSPEQSGERLAAIAAANAFTFLDIWLTDELGHLGDMSLAGELLGRIDRMLGAALPGLGDTTLVLTSDHGNLEEMSARRHTRNPVPLLAVGPGAARFAAAESLLDVAPAVRLLLSSRV